MYKPGDDKLEVRELLVKAFASAWEVGDKTVDRDTYINSSINVIDSLQVLSLYTHLTLPTILRV